jgi:nitrate reductase gamma subunit
MSHLHILAFGIYPYIALAVFLVGSVVRFDYGQYTWRSQSSQLLRRRQLRWGSNLFHIGILLLFFGHLFGLLGPKWLYEGMGVSMPVKQMTAIVFGGAFGVVCLVGIVLLLHRRLTDPRIRATSSTMDIFVLLLIFVQLVLGLATIPFSVGHRDGALMVQMAEWAQYILTFRPEAAARLADVGWIYKLHIFLGLTLFLIFPFTRLVHVWSAPIGYLLRPYQVMRTRHRQPLVRQPPKPAVPAE